MRGNERQHSATNQRPNKRSTAAGRSRAPQIILQLTPSLVLFDYDVLSPAALVDEQQDGLVACRSHCLPVFLHV